MQIVTKCPGSIYFTCRRNKLAVISLHRNFEVSDIRAEFPFQCKSFNRPRLLHSFFLFGQFEFPSLARSVLCYNVNISHFHTDGDLWREIDSMSMAPQSI